MARDRTALALVLACGAAWGAGGCRKAAGGKPDPAAGTPLASKPFYRVDAGPAAACAHGATCEVRLVLTALGDHHINQDYPFKFVGEPAPAPPVDGEGVFAIDDARHGTMTVKFHPAAAGTATLAGTFKLCVCSDETCEIETPRIELAVPVS
ncbi:MAG TPA: hypothetical protein VHT91_36405 [Kofleriaceae bacterium]|nr:hypothetical protein [Kofleriaceae bacterium]